MSFSNFIIEQKNQKKLLLIGLWIVLFITAFLLRSVLLPFVFAALLAYILNPAVTKICNVQFGKYRLPKGLVIVAIYLIIAALVYVFATLFLPQLYRELLRMGKVATDSIQYINQTKIQELALQIDDFFHKYHLPIQIIAPFEQINTDSPAASLNNGTSTHSANLVSINLAQMVQNVLNELGEYIRAQSIDIVDSLQNIIRQIANFIFKFFLVLMLAGFILVDTDRIKRFAFALSLSKNKEKFDAFLNRIDQGLSGAIRGQLLICLVNAVLTFIGLWILQIKFALVLATMAGIFSLIPIFGSIISTIPITMVAFLKSPFMALMALAWIVSIHAFEANFLNPKILGSSTKIHPVIVVLALVTGEHFYGLVGALLAVPITTILLNVFQSLLYKAQDLE